jgi:hypothetical protein
MTLRVMALAATVSITACGNPDARGHAQHAREGSQVSSEAASVAELTEWLRSGDDAQVRRAVDALSRRGPEAAPAIDALMGLLDGSADDLCVAAVRALCGVGPKAAPAVPAMVKMARSAIAAGKGIPEHNCWAVPEAEVRSIGAEAVPALVAELGSDPKTDEIPENMLVALGELALPAVVAVLPEGGPRAESATQVIARLGGVAQPALPALLEAVRNGGISESSFVFAVEQTGVATAEIRAELGRLGREARDESTRRAAAEAARTLRDR